MHKKTYYDLRLNDCHIFRQKCHIDDKMNFLQKVLPSFIKYNLGINPIKLSFHTCKIAKLKIGPLMGDC